MPFLSLEKCFWYITIAPVCLVSNSAPAPTIFQFLAPEPELEAKNRFLFYHFAFWSSELFNISIWLQFSAYN